MRPLALLLVLVPLAAASAPTFPAQLDVSSAEPVELRGRVGVRGSEPSLFSTRPAATGADVLEGATGRVTVYEWERLSGNALDVEAHVGLREPDVQVFRVRGATMRFALAREEFEATLVPRGPSSFSLEGTMGAAGRPLWLERTDTSAPVRLPSPSSPRALSWTWPAGAYFLGVHPLDESMAGFPAWPSATLRARGHVAFQALGGNVSFVDEEGRAVSTRLGHWEEDGSPFPSTPAARVQTWRRLLFEGRVEDASLALDGSWGLAARDVEWSVEGEVAWRDATGTLRRGGAARGFERVDVVGSGVFTSRPEPLELRALADAPVRHDASGEWTSLRVGAESADSPFPSTVPPAAGWTVAAVLLVPILERFRDISNRQL